MSSLISNLANEYSTTASQAKGSAVSAKPKTVCAFIQITGDEASQILEANECSKLAQFGDIYIAEIPLGRLQNLSNENHVKRIEASRPCRATMDTTAIIVNTLPVYAGKNLPQAYTGKGVVVGIQDIAFDLTQPNFYSADMTDYRIRSFWDQLSTDTIGSTSYVGRDYTNETDILQYAHSRDGFNHFHGTLTSGVAAGSGYTSKYRGMAFDSDICLVSNVVTDDTIFIAEKDKYKYTNATDALGFKYIFDYAKRHNQPCVISFSEGFTDDLSADSYLFATVLDSLVGPGRIFVTSAGNESRSPTYFHKPKGVYSAGSFLNNGSTSHDFMIKADGLYTLNFLIYNKSISTDTMMIHSTKIDSIYKDTLVSLKNGNIYTVKINRYPSAYSVSDTMYQVNFKSSTTLNSSAPVAVVAEGDTTDVEVFGDASDSFGNFSNDTRWNAAEDSHNILMPGAVDRVITVGATAHRFAFTNYKGTYIDLSYWGSGGKRAIYSSVGPTYAGLMKPDVMAPGNQVVSSNSSYYIANHSSDWDVARFQYNNRTYSWRSDQGTSLSTPVVAGAIALWLQAKPDLTPEEIKQVFSRTCTHPDESLSYPNNYYGYGQIDVYKGLLDILGLDGIRGISDYCPQSVEVLPRQNGVKLIFDTAPVDPFVVRIFTSSGLMTDHIRVPVTGEKAYDIDMSSSHSGVYLIQIDTKNIKTTGSVLIRQ